MQNAGIYHIAAQLTALLRSSVPRGTAPGPRWGHSPQTPSFSRYALGLISADNVRCRAVYIKSSANFGASC